MTSSGYNLLHLKTRVGCLQNRSYLSILHHRRRDAELLSSPILMECYPKVQKNRLNLCQKSELPIDRYQAIKFNSCCYIVLGNSDPDRNYHWRCNISLLPPYCRELKRHLFSCP